MKKRFFTSFLGCILGCAAFLGLVGQGFVRIGGLPSLTEIRKGFFQDDRITLSIKALTQEEAQEYLKGDIVKWGYQPVQLTVENQTADPYLVSPELVDLPLINSDKVAYEIVKKAIPRAIAFKIFGFVFWPLIIPSTIDTLMTIKSHNKLKRGLFSKTLKAEIVAPYSVLNRVFFLSDEENPSSFNIHLENQENLLQRTFYVENLPTQEPATLYSQPVIQENYYLTHG